MGARTTRRSSWNGSSASLAAGIAGAPDPQTPLVALPVDAAFVDVPTVDFQPIPPPEEEPPPEAPALAGATWVQGRYGVVAGERRTTVWAYTVDPQTYPWAEPLEAALPGLASSRTGGAPATGVEVLGRVVQRSDGAEGATSARAFRHGASRRSCVEGGPTWIPRSSCDASRACSGRRSLRPPSAGASRRPAEPARLRPGYSWTSSMRVPKLPFGCTKATVVPRLPGRGAWSMAVAPAATMAARAAAQSSTR